MSSDSEEFINMDNHFKKIKLQVQKIKDRCLNNTRQYLNELSKFFIKYIDLFISEEYEHAIIKSHEDKTKSNPLKTIEDLKRIVTDKFFPIYKKHFFENPGGMLPRYPNFENDVTFYMDLAEEALEKKCNSLVYSVKKKAKQNKISSAKWVIGLILAILGIIGWDNLKFIGK